MNNLKRRLSDYLSSLREISPEEGYNLWAAQYDKQPGNLMLALEEALFDTLIKSLPLEGKTIADVGCGTGRHWKKILMQAPARLSGYDISEGMLSILREKFPGAETSQLKDNRLPDLEDQSCDVVISTLTLAHIKNLREALLEWNRVLKPGGEMLLTDYHPEALMCGGNRTFRHNHRLIFLKNYIHPLERIRILAGTLQFEITDFEEKKIDETVRDYYERQRAMHIFRRFKGVPIVYGIRLKKVNATA